VPFKAGLTVIVITFSDKVYTMWHSTAVSGNIDLTQGLSHFMTCLKPQ